MGEISITGKASRECKYDRMEITIRFDIHDVTAAKAIEKLDMQFEECLEELEAQGVPTVAFNIERDDVSHDRRRDYTDVTASRSIKVKLPFDMKVSNFLMNFIRKKGYDADVNISYKVSNMKEIHDQLIAEAIQDSKAKAETIAEIVNERIIGIKSIELQNKGFSLPKAAAKPAMACEIHVPDFLRKSNDLNSGTTEEAENVNVIWLLSGN